MTDFPMDAVIFNKIVEVFNQTRRYVLLLFPLAFFIRIAFGFILLKTDSFIDILKDSLFLFLGLFFFTDILKLALQIPYFVSGELSFGEWRNINLGEGLFTNALKRIVDWIGIVSYWVSFGLYVVIISILGFFAGYILFFGTMFRLYGMLKVFFTLLFIVSLWPLLWHSINFAVWTIAVSDNALANNVIIGGASLAKVFVPLWLISKTSKIPVAQTLKKLSWTGGNLAYAGGSYATSFLRDKTDHVSFNQNVQEETALEINNEGAKISVTQEGQNFQNQEAYSNGLIDRPMEDFSISEKEKTPSLENTNHNNMELSHERNNHQGIEQEITAKQAINQENNVSQESHIQNETTKEFRTNSNPQVGQEQAIPVSHLQENQSYNASLLENPQSQELRHEVSNKEKKPELFNEAVHREEWIEGEENHIAPPAKKKKKKENLSYETA